MKWTTTLSLVMLLWAAAMSLKNSHHAGTEPTEAASIIPTPPSVKTLEPAIADTYRDKRSRKPGSSYGRRTLRHAQAVLRPPPLRLPLHERINASADF